MQKQTLKLTERLARLKKKLDISSSSDQYSSDIMKVFISGKASASGNIETIEVIVWKNKGQYKLQWTERNKPKMPELKANIKKILSETTNNSTTYLTSGYGDMRTVDDVLRLINLLEENGLVFDL